MDCPNCKGNNIIYGVEFGQTAQPGAIGLDYSKGKFSRGTEPIVADLCKDCGTIIRIYVLNTDKNWMVKK